MILLFYFFKMAWFW